MELDISFFLLYLDQKNNVTTSVATCIYMYVCVWGVRVWPLFGQHILCDRHWVIIENEGTLSFVCEDGCGREPKNFGLIV